MGARSGSTRRVWTAKEIPNGVEMTLVSKDGDMGYPGTLTVHVRYTLEKDALRIDYGRDDGQDDDRQRDQP